ncbi:hypothetical protein GCM10023322_35350 [Rugosimonospora acidiphila]|uniref:Pentapeptide repeat-containing protein n=1 Tax=Rugosimonospora acidiphila TaxID=556531 RepID=A0ABP9RWD4_9ACTN
MEYLGTFVLRSGSKWFYVTKQDPYNPPFWNRLHLTDRDPGLAGRFLIYDVGGGWLSLQSSNGGWVNFWIGEAWEEWMMTVLQADTDPSGGTRFTKDYLDIPGKRLQLITQAYGGWYTIIEASGLGAECRCEWTCANTRYWYRPFTLEQVTPGVPQIRAGGCAGVDFGPVGDARIDLSGADLSGVNASRARFGGAILRGANLSSADLSGAVFTGAAMDNTELRGANLTGAVFTGAALNNTDLRGADLTAAVFTGAALNNTDLRDLSTNQKTRLAGADFSGTTVTSVSFPSPLSSDMTGERVLLRNATASIGCLGMNWSNVDLTGATILDLPRDQNGAVQLPELVGRRMKWPNANLHGANLRKADLHQAVLSGANLVEADLSNADLGDAWLEVTDDLQHAANLSGAMLLNANFSNAHLRGVHFIGAYLFGLSATVTNATLTLANFTNAYLAGMDFSNIRDLKMQSVTFVGACLVNCRFKGSQPRPLDGSDAAFNHACLHGADFTDCTLAGANLREAAVATQPGKLPVTLTIRGQRQQIEVSYEATILPQSITNDKTICPSGAIGPCDPAKQVAKNPPTQWPSPVSYLTGERRQLPPPWARRDGTLVATTGCGC